MNDHRFPRCAATAAPLGSVPPSQAIRVRRGGDPRGRSDRDQILEQLRMYLVGAGIVVLGSGLFYAVDHVLAASAHGTL